MKYKYLILPLAIFLTLLTTSCGKNKEISYAYLQGEWYSETCGITIIFTSENTLTMQNDGFDEVLEYAYSLDPNGKIFITINDRVTERNIEFINNRKIMIDKMGVWTDFETGEHIFKKRIF